MLEYYFVDNNSTCAIIYVPNLACQCAKIGASSFFCA